jgi:hypothetical protein
LITIGKNGERIAYGIKHYNLDTEADLKNLPIHNVRMGTTCFVISTSKYYMLNSDSEWIEISPFSAGSTSSGGGDSDSGSGDGGSGDGDPSDDIIYEGGVI